MKKIFLFDLDGTLAESAQIINDDMIKQLDILKKNSHEIGIVGGGDFIKMSKQINNKITFDHIFSECGSVYYRYNNIIHEYELIYKNNITDHSEYYHIDRLVKKTLEFLSHVDYTLSGNFIDRRNGLMYISLIGMQATNSERERFMDLDKKYAYRERLMNILIEYNTSTQLDILLGGSVGIAIYPKEWNKVQVLHTIKKSDYDSIYYFGDRYLENGNDYALLHADGVTGIKVDSPEDTIQYLQSI